METPNTPSTFPAFGSIEDIKRQTLLKALTGAPGGLPPASIIPQSTPAPRENDEKNKISQNSSTVEIPPSKPEHLIGYDPLFGLEDLVDFHYFIRPHIKLHPWQHQELLRVSGWPSGRKVGERIHWYKYQPNIASYVCCNGSGKDDILIGNIAAGMPLLYRDVYTVATSASHEQLKNQTDTRITGVIRDLNAKLGFNYYHSTEFHHRHEVAPGDTRGGQIKLFATDEAGRAEGWHPLTPTGRLLLVVNEAKTISAPILAAMDRCRGYSGWYEISSPGIRSGAFYKNYKLSSKFADGAIAEPFKYFSRKVDAFQCPHISKEEIQLVLDKHGYSSYIYQTSILANFAETIADVVIPFSLIEACESVPYMPGDIGIGLDCAAGGDETVVYVRRGNKPIAFHYFQESNAVKSAEILNEFLAGYKADDYIFNADNGGVGSGLLDNLENLGWVINRKHNQSPALFNKLCLNYGAESYRYVRDLFEARNIIPPTDEKTLLQLSTRKDSNASGKFKLEPKKAVRAAGGESPDRADAFVLCFDSYPLTSLGFQEPPEPITRFSAADLLAMSLKDPGRFHALFSGSQSRLSGRPTLLKNY